MVSRGFQLDGSDIPDSCLEGKAGLKYLEDDSSGFRLEDIVIPL